MSKEKISAEYDLFADFENVDADNIIVGTVKQTLKKISKNASKIF